MDPGSSRDLNKSPLPDDPDSRPLFFMGEDVLVRTGFPQGELKIYGEDGKRIILGVCAMPKKSNSKPMREILDRLEKFMHIQTLIFEEDVILNEDVENWPVVDVLISFFSTGFPLDKAIAYKNLRNPFVINDLESQQILQDRREVYKILVNEGISHPRYAVCDRTVNCSPTCAFSETEDHVEVNGNMFIKPFVEKPISAEDHNVYIYFPAAAGGGSQRLFRKVGSRSSVYSQYSRVRKKGSYIYEEFMPTDGTDVKVYTVGPDYAHAEARKSPALDGKVERDKNGKEVRYPVLLSAKEKLLARKVCLAFKQSVCGFDLLRANGTSYVCDVNGFSFVKNSLKYYDDCAKILGTMIMRALAPQLHIPWVLGSAPEDIPVVPTTSGSMMELRCVVAVIRHGDRTPKQKMKMEVKHKKFFDLFNKYNGYKTGHLKLKKPKQLQEVLDIARFLLSENMITSDPEIAEKKVKLQQLKLVLEMYGHFSGINRKVQLKYQPYGHPKKSSSEEDDCPREPSLLLIVKWGGELTPAGKIQAEDLGKAFRSLYPGGQGEFEETPGLGFLRLHSTFRHDLKIYASDEGRVQMTAAAFTKGLLALEGELTPILVQMVKSANTNGLLDKQGETSKSQRVVKDRLMHIFNENRQLTEADYMKIAPTCDTSLKRALEFTKNPRKQCEHVHNMVKELTAQIRKLMIEHRTRDLKLYHGESWELLIRRWAKLEKDFKMKDGRYDITKIPDIYDCIKYDLQHNQKTLQYDKSEELFRCSKALADIIIPQEYGITVDEKLHISQSICTPLMRKISSDLVQCVYPGDEDDDSTRLNSKYSKGVSSPERFVRTRLYFTSESHIHSLLNMFKFGGLCDYNNDEQWKKAIDFISATEELNYMTQIVIMMFEDPTKEPTSDERFHIELHFSPGAYTSSDKSVERFPIGSGCRTLSFKQNSKNGQKDTLDVSSIKTLHSRVISAPSVIQEDAEEIDEAELFDHGIDSDDTTTKSPSAPHDFKLPLKKLIIPPKLSTVPQTKSPDPDVPEWDWGDEPENKSEDTSSDKDNDQEQESGAIPVRESWSSPAATNFPMSPPIEIRSQGSKGDLQSSSYEPVRSSSLEEKRSRSLEDKRPEIKDNEGYLSATLFWYEPDYTPLRRHSHTPGMALDAESDVGINNNAFYVERNYRTVHLPVVGTDKQRAHSFSSLFYMNPDAFKAFESFSMVPSLCPLETLHNNLTMKYMLEFLTRAATYKFVTPISSPPKGGSTPISLTSPRPTNTMNTKASLPSSSSSSAGPSSPTSASTPMDILTKLKIYISAQQETGNVVEPSLDSSHNTTPSNSDSHLSETKDFDQYMQQQQRKLSLTTDQSENVMYTESLQKDNNSDWTASGVGAHSQSEDCSAKAVKSEKVPVTKEKSSRFTITSCKDEFTSAHEQSQKDIQRAVSSPENEGQKEYLKPSSKSISCIEDLKKNESS